MAEQHRGIAAAVFEYEDLPACIQRGVVYPTPPYSGVNPAVQYRVTLNQQGQPVSVTLTGSSGIAGFDRSVQAGIQSCNPFPKPQQGNYPGYIDGTYQMFDETARPGTSQPNAAGAR